jgi:Helix-turn-helix domain
MSTKDILDRIANLPPGPSDIAGVPPPELIGFCVRWERGLRQWKRSTLADFACVSVSTIERVERGEKVSDEALDRIAQGLDYEPGRFTAPGAVLDLHKRRPVSWRHSEKWKPSLSPR